MNGLFTLRHITQVRDHLSPLNTPRVSSVEQLTNELTQGLVSEVRLNHQHGVQTVSKHFRRELASDSSHFPQKHPPKRARLTSATGWRWYSFTQQPQVRHGGDPMGLQAGMSTEGRCSQGFRQQAIATHSCASDGGRAHNTAPRALPH